MHFPLALLPIPGQTVGQAAGFLRSTSGCGAMGERSPERSQLRMLRRCGGSVSRMQDGRGLKPSSAEDWLHWQGRRNKFVGKNVYNIVYDIVYVIISYTISHLCIRHRIFVRYRIRYAMRYRIRYCIRYRIRYSFHCHQLGGPANLYERFSYHSLCHRVQTPAPKHFFLEFYT